jgi:DsbC/DsbD-like thiol-disulfide interchange protein
VSVQRLIAGLLAFACAAALAAPVVKTEHVEAQLFAERESAQAGKPMAVGLRLRMAPHWHTYWKNPGDSGLPTKIQWELPAGWKAGEIQWPYPRPLPVGPLMNYGYEDEVLLVSDITPAASTAPGKHPIKAKAEWLVCKDVCIPEKGEVDLVVTVGSAEGPPDSRSAAQFERARAQLPFEPSGWKFESALQGKSLVVRMAPPAGTTPPQKVAFFPERELLIEPAAPQKVTRDGNAVRIEMKLAEPVLKDVGNVKGVAVSESGWGGNLRKAMSVDAPQVASLPAAAAPVSGASEAGGGIGGSLAVALAFAFLGGIR